MGTIYFKIEQKKTELFVVYFYQIYEILTDCSTLPHFSSVFYSDMILIRYSSHMLKRDMIIHSTAETKFSPVLEIIENYTFIFYLLDIFHYDNPI